MKPVSLLAIALVLLAAVAATAQRRGFPGYPEDGSDDIEVDPNQKAEWAFARFHYSVGDSFGGFRRFQRWAADYPKSDRQFVMGVRRLTRLDARSMEQVVDAHSDEIFNWPWVYVEDPGGWRLSEPEAVRLREFLLKGGFMFLDDSHGNFEWENIVEGLHMIFPDRAIEDLPGSDEIYRVFYDLNQADQRFQIPGTRFIWGGRPYGPDSAVPQWRAVRDDKGRVMVGICHNSDVGDAWEWADSPHYPENAASLAYRIGVNYIIYGMTH